MRTMADKCTYSGQAVPARTSGLDESCPMETEVIEQTSRQDEVICVPGDLALSTHTQKQGDHLPKHL